jgi:hypothetical protein
MCGMRGRGCEGYVEGGGGGSTSCMHTFDVCVHGGIVECVGRPVGVDEDVDV